MVGCVGVSNTANSRLGVASPVVKEPPDAATNSIPAHNVAPVVPAVVPPVVLTTADDGLPSPKEGTATRKAYTRMDTRVLIAIPPTSHLAQSITCQTWCPLYLPCVMPCLGFVYLAMISVQDLEPRAGKVVSSTTCCVLFALPLPRHRR